MYNHGECTATRSCAMLSLRVLVLDYSTEYEIHPERHAHTPTLVCHVPRYQYITERPPENLATCHIEARRRLSEHGAWLIGSVGERLAVTTGRSDRLILYSLVMIALLVIWSRARGSCSRSWAVTGYRVMRKVPRGASETWGARAESTTDESATRVQL